MSPWCQSSQSCAGSGGTSLYSAASGYCKLLPWTCCPALRPWAPQQGHQTFVQIHEKSQTHCNGHKDVFLISRRSKSVISHQDEDHWWLVLTSTFSLFLCNVLCQMGTCRLFQAMTFDLSSPIADQINPGGRPGLPRTHRIGSATFSLVGVVQTVVLVVAG